MLAVPVRQTTRTVAQIRRRRTDPGFPSDDHGLSLKSLTTKRLPAALLSD